MQSLTVWKHITYILQTFAFFIVGMEIPRVIRLLEPDQIQPLLVITAIIVVVLIGARFVFIGAMVAARPHAWGGGSMAWKSATILSWAGARGPISGLAVFTVPLVLDSGDQFPDRNLLVAVTFLVILVTLILAPTLAPLARRLNIPDDDEKEMERVARVAAMRAALERLDALVEDSERAGDPLPQSVVSALRVPVQEDIARVVAVDSADDTTDELRLRALQREMLHAEQEEIVRMREDGEIPDTVSRRLQSDLDVRLQAARNRRNG
jgi:CPA1 family monovalent cation:H+ antiporter